MNKIVKILLSLFVVFTILATGLYFFIASKIKPEEIRKMAITQIEKNLPGSRASIEKIDYSIGLAITLYVKSFKVQVVNPETDLFNVDQVEVKIPIWAILTNGGNIDLHVNSPKVLYKELNENVSNLSVILPKDSKTPNDIEEKKDTPSDLKINELPAFIQKSAVNIRIEDMVLQYLPLNGQNANVKIGKILLKNIGLDKLTAYEVDSLIKYQMEQNKELQTKILVVGEIDLKKAIEDKEIITNLILNVSETKMTDLKYHIPDIKNKIDIKIDKDKNITLKVDSKSNETFSLETDVVMTNTMIDVKKLEFDFSFDSLKNILDKETLSKLTILETKGVHFKLDGNAQVKPETKEVIADIKFYTTGKIKANFIPEIPIATELKGSFNKNNVEVQIISEMLKGTVVTELKTFFDPTSPKTDILALAPINLNITGSNMTVEKEFINKFIYAPSDTETAANAAQTTNTPVQNPPGDPVELPPVNLMLNFTNIFIGPEKMYLNALIKTERNKVWSEKFQFGLSKGEGQLTFNTVLNLTNDIDTKFQFQMNELNFSAFNAFLPPIMAGVEGAFYGKVNGGLHLMPNGKTYKFNVNVRAEQGELKDLDLNKYIAPVLAKIKEKAPNLVNFSKEDFIRSGKFEKFLFDSEMTEKKIVINQMELIGDKGSFDFVKTKGHVSMKENEKSEVKTTYKDKSGLFVKHLKRDDIPLLLKGNGFIIIPDETYTLELVVGGAINKELDKAKKAIEQKLNEEKKKLEVKVNAEIDKQKKKLNKEKEKAKKEIEKKAKGEAEKFLKGMIKP